MTPGRILALVLLVVGGLGWLIGDDPIYRRMVYLAGLVGLTALLWTRLSLSQVRVRRWARFYKAQVGEVFEERFEVENKGRFPIFSLEVWNDSPLPGAAGSRLLTFLGPQRTITYNARTYLTQRGQFPLGPTRLVSSDPFGLFRSQRELSAEATLIVLPALYSLTSFPFLAGQLPGGRVLRRRSSEVTPHAAGVREYLPGDPLRSIHWPSSARRAKLMVKEFEQDPLAEIWLVLDLQQGVHCAQPYVPPVLSEFELLYGRLRRLVLPPSTLEYAVTIAASLGRYFLQRKWPVGLVAGNRAVTVLPAESGPRQQARMLEMLALLQADGTLSLAALLSTQARYWKPGSSVILITPDAQPLLLQAVGELQQRHLTPMAILLDSATFGGAARAEEMERSLVHNGVAVCRIRHGDDLEHVLSQFSLPRQVTVWSILPSVPLT